MAQQAISSYFATRKRTASDDLSSKNKVLILDRNELFSPSVSRKSTRKIQKLAFDTDFEKQTDKVVAKEKPKPRKKCASTKVSVAKSIRVGKVKKSAEKNDGLHQSNLVNFIRKGLLSPTKTRSPVKVSTPKKSVFVSRESEMNSERGMVTPIKQTISSDPRPSSSKEAIKDLPLEVVKEKLNKSSRVTELKTRLNKLQQGLDTLDTMETKRKAMVTPKKTVEITKDICQPRSLKKFDALELEIVR